MNKAILMSLYLFLISIIAGCASTGSYTASGEKITNIQESLSQGEIRLTCGTPIVLSLGRKADENEILIRKRTMEKFSNFSLSLRFSL